MDLGSEKPGAWAFHAYYSRDQTPAMAASILSDFERIIGSGPSIWLTEQGPRYFDPRVGETTGQRDMCTLMTLTSDTRVKRFYEYELAGPPLKNDRNDPHEPVDPKRDFDSGLIQNIPARSPQYALRPSYSTYRSHTAGGGGDPC